MATCKACGKPLDRRRWSVQKGLAKYCGHSCQAKSRTGDKNPNWNGGRWVDAGRTMVHVPGAKRNRMLEYRHIVEQALGRKLRRGEVVHHINYDRNDNRPENLQVMGHAEHVKLHAKTLVHEKDTRTGRFIGGHDGYQ